MAEKHTEFNSLMHSKGHHYQSYLLRLWEDGEGRPCIFLERITSPNERIFFSSLDELFLYLLNNWHDVRGPPEDIEQA